MRVLQERLQELAEYESWFQEGKELYRYDSYTVSACREVMATYIGQTACDLYRPDKNAYDSVPRNALWMVYGKLGMPEQTLQFISSRHASQDPPGR